jgi:hypothetical protein
LGGNKAIHSTPLYSSLIVNEIRRLVGEWSNSVIHLGVKTGRGVGGDREGKKKK